MPFLLLLCSGLSAQDGVADELEVCTWAYRPAEHSDEILAASKSERWNDRARALDALTRDLAACGVVTDLHQVCLRRGLGDGHVSVRTRALQLAAAIATAEPGSLDLSTAELDEAARAAHPALRLALVEALLAGACLSGNEQAEELLAGFLVDPDERLRAAVLGGLAASADLRPGRRGSALELVPGLSAEESLVLWTALFRASGAAAAEAPLVGAVQVETHPEWRAAQRGLLAALLICELPSTQMVGELEQELRASLMQQADWTSSERSLLKHVARRWEPGVRAVLFEALRRASMDEASDAVADEFAELLSISGPPELVLQEVLQYDVALWPVELRVAAVDAAAGRVTDWGATGLGEVVAGYLSTGASLEVRSALVMALVLGLRESLDASTSALLALCVDDPERNLAARAFIALAGAQGGAREMDSLARAWIQLDATKRIQRLERTSRETPLVPLRSALLEWASKPGPERSSAIELLGAFQGDDGVRSHLEAWVLEELDIIDAGDARARQSMGRAAQLARALGRVDSPGSVPVLLEVLRRTHAEIGDIAKTAVASLALSQEGCEQLPKWMDNNIGRRARVEVALVLLAAETTSEEVRDRAVGRLAADYGGLAWDLAERVIASLGKAEGRRASMLLRGLAHGGLSKERAASLEALGSREGELATAQLEEAALEDADLELRRRALRLLGRRSDGAALERIGTQLEQGNERLPPGFKEALLTEQRVALVASGRGRAGFMERWLEHGLHESKRVLGMRLRGERPESAEFLWRDQLSMARQMASQGRLGSGLERAGPWWKLESRFLMALAREARAESADLAFELQRAGLIAQAGERDVRSQLAGDARARLISMAWAAKRWRGIQGLLRGTLVEHRRGVSNQRAFEAAFGSVDRAQGVDPQARLESALLHARAREALAAGELGKARRLAEEAVPILGASREAREAQQALERDLSRAAVGNPGKTP